MKNLSRLIFILALLAMLLPGSHAVLAQTGTLSGVSLNYIEAVPDAAAGQVTINAYVSVIDEEGQPVASLSPEDFSVIEDGNPVELESVTIADDPIAVIIVLDTSGSMARIGPNGQPAIETAKQAAISFIGGLAEGDRAAVIGFNDEVSLLVDITHDHNAVINSINQLSYKDFGGTCLYDATMEAVKKSTEAPQGRRAIIVLTDGVDEASESEGACSLFTLTDVVDEATSRTNKVPVFTLGFGDVDDRELLRLARLTGGQGLIGKSEADLAAMFEMISRQLNSQYRLSYQTRSASGEHAVVVKVAGAGVGGSDQRSVFVPAVQAKATPTATPAPTATLIPLTVAIVEATKDKPEPGFLQVLVEVNPPGQITRSELFLDGESVAALTESPFDVFNLRLSELTSGEKVMRVEVTGLDGTTASSERNITISLPPTPAPTAIPTPTPNTLQQVMAAPADNPLYVALAVAACLIVLLIVGIIGYLLLGRRKKQPQQQVQQPLAVAPTYRPFSAAPEPVDVFATHDEAIPTQPSSSFGVADPSDPYATIDEMVAFAELKVVESETVSVGKTFPIRKIEVKIGRDTVNVKNDINIPDSTVSRHHATITFDGSNFTVYSKSRNGVFVDNIRVGDSGQLLPPQAEIKLGTKTRLKFTAGKTDSLSGYDIDPDATVLNI
jgi:VWFA-related protein